MSNIYLINDLEELAEEVQSLLNEIHHIVNEDEVTESLVSHIK